VEAPSISGKNRAIFRTTGQGRPNVDAKISLKNVNAEVKGWWTQSNNRTERRLMLRESGTLKNPWTKGQSTLEEGKQAVKNVSTAGERKDWKVTQCQGHGCKRPY